MNTQKNPNSEKVYQCSPESAGCYGPRISLKAMSRGYTAVELIQVIAFFAFWGVIGLVVVHFIAKFW